MVDSHWQYITVNGMTSRAMQVLQREWVPSFKWPPRRAGSSCQLAGPSPTPASQHRALELKPQTSGELDREGDMTVNSILCSLTEL